MTNFYTTFTGIQLTLQEGITAAIEEGTGQYLVLPLRPAAQTTGKQSLDSHSQTPREAQPKHQQQQPHPRPKALQRFPIPIQELSILLPFPANSQVPEGFGKRIIFLI